MNPEIDFKTPKLTYVLYVLGIMLLAINVYHYGFEYQDSSQLMLFSISSLTLIFVGWSYETHAKQNVENQRQWEYLDQINKEIFNIKSKKVTK